ncbi:hypothetical protein JXO52_06795 [bacterium]|nr:hypothetical protein [bacterium]
MRRVLQIISAAGLAMVIVPAFLVFAGRIPWRTHADLMLAGTVLWFVTAPFWMGMSGKKGKG